MKFPVEVFLFHASCKLNVLNDIIVYGMLVQKIIDIRMMSEADDFSESEFARLYRGLVICTLQSQDDEASLLLLKQAQEIILMCDAVGDFCATILNNCAIICSIRMMK